MNKMIHFKHSDCSITYVGWNDEKKVYSLNYYANVGICNAEESKHTSWRKVLSMIESCKHLGYTEVTYLPND